MGSCVASATNMRSKSDQKLKQIIVDEEIKSDAILRQNERHKLKKAGIDNRLKSIGISDALNANLENREKTYKDVKFLGESLSKHFIFNNITEEQKDIIISKMKLYSSSPGSVIFEQDQPGNNFFIIASGKVEVVIDQQRKNLLKAGDSFGELALLHVSFRSAYIKTLEKTSLWSLDRHTFMQVVHSMNTLNYKENKHFIKNIPIFKILSNDQIEALLNSFILQKFSPGNKILNYGDHGELFYIIKEGTVSVITEGEEIRKMGKGDYFGEQALLYKKNRTATIISITEVLCLAIGSDALNNALGDKLQHIIYNNSIKIAIEKDKYLCKLTGAQIDNIISNMKIESYSINQKVISKGSLKSESLKVVVKGSLQSSTELFQLFDCIASTEFAEKSSSVFMEDMICYEESDIASIQLEAFENIIGGDLITISSNNEVLATLKQVLILSTLIPDDLNKIIKTMKFITYDPGQTIFEENEPGESFFIIKSGKVEVIKSSIAVRNMGKFDYFGERSLLFNSARSATIKAITKVECWCLYREDFLGIFTEPVKNQLLKRIDLQDDQIELCDLACIKVVGKGMFGNVFQVVNKNKRIQYALKCVSRKKIEAYQIQKSIVLERKVILQLDHPMIMKLVKTFKDENRLYFLMELVVGLDLFDVLQKMNILNESDAKFYTSCLITILEHLHSRDIVYRDLKPENVVIDEDGYPKLIDFGISKIIKGRTFTLVGTPHYMPPEIITGKGYNTTADYWSLGIMLYEFLCGCLPFGDDVEEPYTIYEKILSQKLAYPVWIDQNMVARKVIDQLLSKNSSNRLGGSVQNLKNHIWFSGTNWEKLLIKSIKSPFIPDIKDATHEINAAIEASERIEDFILREENKDQVRNRPSKAVEIDENWDKDF